MALTAYIWLLDIILITLTRTIFNKIVVKMHYLESLKEKLIIFGTIKLKILSTLYYSLLSIRFAQPGWIFIEFGIRGV
jgi:hypothetical protein